MYFIRVCICTSHDSARTSFEDQIRVPHHRAGRGSPAIPRMCSQFRTQTSSKREEKRNWICALCLFSSPSSTASHFLSLLFLQPDPYHFILWSWWWWPTSSMLIVTSSEGSSKHTRIHEEKNSGRKKNVSGTRWRSIYAFFWAKSRTSKWVLQVQCVREVSRLLACSYFGWPAAFMYSLPSQHCVTENENPKNRLEYTLRSIRIILAPCLWGPAEIFRKSTVETHAVAGVEGTLFGEERNYTRAMSIDFANKIFQFFNVTKPLLCAVCVRPRVLIGLIFKPLPNNNHFLWRFIRRYLCHWMYSHPVGGVNKIGFRIILWVRMCIL